MKRKYYGSQWVEISKRKIKRFFFDHANIKELSGIDQLRHKVNATSGILYFFQRFLFRIRSSFSSPLSPLRTTDKRVFSLSPSSLSLLFLGLVRHVFALWQSCENLFLFGRLPKKNISLFTEKRVFLPVSHPHFDLFARFFLTLSLSFPSSLRLDGAQSSTFFIFSPFCKERKGKWQKPSFAQGRNKTRQMGRWTRKNRFVLNIILRIIKTMEFEISL